MKYGCSLKSTPVASNLLNQLWGCFPANSCLDTNTSLATAWPAAISVHLMLTGAAGLSCWWNTVILFLITVCSMWDPPGLRIAIRDLHVYVHSMANKQNRLAPWKHLSNTLNRYLSIQTKDFSFITRQMSSDMEVNTTPWEKWKLLKHVQSPELTCIISFQILKPKSDAPPVTAVFANLFLHARELQPCSHWQTHKTGNAQKSVSKTKPTALNECLFWSCFHG